MKVTVHRFSASSSFRNLTNLTFVLLLIGLISHCRVHSLATKNFVVFGASGKTGALIVKRLLSENIEGRKIICPVRNLAKARAILGPESKFLSLLPCDLERDGNEKVIDIVNNADAVVISSAYSPGTFISVQCSSYFFEDIVISSPLVLATLEIFSFLIFRDFTLSSIRGIGPTRFEGFIQSR
jgi:hypothetical protein